MTIVCDDNRMVLSAKLKGLNIESVQQLIE